MMEDVTHERSFGEQAGRYFQGVLEEHGVEVDGGDELARFEGDGGRVRTVVTKGGRELEATCVVIGAGVAPDVTLARAAGLELGERGGVRARRAAGDGGAGRLRGGRHRRVRQRRCTGARCGSSTGTSPSTTARRRR